MTTDAPQTDATPPAETARPNPQEQLERERAATATGTATGTDAEPQRQTLELPAHIAGLPARLSDDFLRERLAEAALSPLLNYALTHRALNDCILQVTKDAWRVADAVIASRNEPVGA